MKTSVRSLRAIILSPLIKIMIVALCVLVASEYAPMKEALRMVENVEGIVVDVGANGGVETRLALDSHRKVVSVECLSDAYITLHRMFSANTNVTLVHACAGDKAGARTLNLADDSSSLIESNVQFGPERRKAHRKHNTIRRHKEVVLVMPLDQMITDKVALLKIDVQGFENEVILGASSIIERDSPLIIYEDEEHFKKQPIVLPSGYVCSGRKSRDRICQKTS